MKTFIVDGYNFAHAIPEFSKSLEKNLQAGRDALVKACMQYVSGRAHAFRIVIVFDGSDRFADMPSFDAPGLSVIFTASREKADDRILEMIQETKRPEDFFIVSDDNYVFNHSRSLRARGVTCAEFYAGLTRKKDDAKNKAVTREKPALREDIARKITEEYKRRLGIP